MTSLMTFLKITEKISYFRIESRFSRLRLASASRRALLSYGAIGTLIAPPMAVSVAEPAVSAGQLSSADPMSVARRTVMKAQVSITGHPIGREISADGGAPPRPPLRPGAVPPGFSLHPRRRLENMFESRNHGIRCPEIRAGGLPAPASGQAEVETHHGA